MKNINLLTMKQLRAFAAVYRLGKLSAAAEHLSITVSAVSVLIRQIEISLNVQLFDRANRALSPTAAAHEAIDSTERILREVALLEAGILEQTDRRRGRVHFAVTPAIGMALMPKTVRSFARINPDVRVVIEDCAPDQFLPRILNGQVEFGVGTPEEITKEIDVATLVDDKLCLVCAADHPLAKKSRVRWADLASVPMIAVRPGYGIRRVIDRMAVKVGVKLSIVIEANFLSSALWMASSGLGVVLLPSALLVQSHFKNVVARPLVAPTVSRAISVVTRRGRSLSPACQGFVDMLMHDLSRNRGVRGSED